MPTAAERQALLFLAAVAVIGGGARLVQQSRFTRELAAAEHRAEPLDSALDSTQLDTQLAAVDSARSAHGRRSSRKRAPRVRESSPAADQPILSSQTAPARAPPTRTRKATAKPDTPIDVNRATAAELEQLPRVGPALAQRIVAWREAHGRFQSMEDLRHVRGIGKATAAILASTVTF